ncbi:hypothetical protein [uncultured Paenibacillus sp.]|uniref:hypothetical protein n=1 Tax=uncultured Paenibacillus sp. TaxID=227322 RepID=UPI0028D603AE|nr:hypothetical protein [uncultured Paenibacillus sp.]
MLRYTLQYIPLSKIKPGISVQITKRIMELRKAAQDCMHVLVVRKSRKQGGYLIVSGVNNYEYIRKHTKKKTVPCLVDESKAASSFAAFMSSFRKRKLPYDVPWIKKDRVAPGSWSIIRTFMKQEPRFRQLTRNQQIKVLRLGLQYKKTTISSMKAKVDVWVKK